MRNRAALLSLMTLGMMSMNNYHDHTIQGENDYKPLTPEEMERYKLLLKQRQIDILKQKGCKEFTIDGITVIALNEKNAIRKINNIKKILK